jgi:iron complex outermembrane recepter protein
MIKLPGGIVTLLLATCLVVGATLAHADAEARPITYVLDIPAEDLTAALQSFAIASHHKLLYKAELTAGKSTRGLRGQFTAEQAMQGLLDGTGLTFEITGSSVVLIKEVSAGGKTGALIAPLSADAMRGSQVEEAHSTSSTQAAYSGALRLAQAGQEPSSGDGTVADQKQADTGLGELIVTAQKKSERLQDVPIPVSVISAQSLRDQNQLRFEDYFSDFPGLNFSSGDRGELFPAIRGLSTGSYSNPTVGIVIDDVPYGASAESFSAPDIDPSDLAHVEVLRGPQGTLYGVSSIGGLIKYVTVDPTTDGFSGRVEAGTSTTYNGAKLGYSFRAAVNVPLGNTLAFRASGYSEELPGYIDNPLSGVRGVNKITNTGGHFAALWTPEDGFSVKLSALVQKSRSGGSSESVLAPGLGDLEQNLMPGQGGFQRDITSLSATIKARLGEVDLTSVTGYLASRLVSSLDLSTLFGPYIEPVYGVTGSGFYQWNPIDKFSQELRLSGKFGHYADWLLGGFFTNEHGPQTQEFMANNLATGAAVAVFGTDDYPYLFKEYAIFGDFTAHFTDRFDVQFGGRETWDQVPAFTETTSGEYASMFLGSDPSLTNVEGDSYNSFTYLVTPQFKISPELMVYLRLASGFRPGGGNDMFATFAGAPSTYGPDKTNNYEVGVKGNTLNHSLSFDVSLYRIDWKEVQLSVEDSIGNSYTVNAGRAKSQGLEVSVEEKPLAGTTIDAWVTLNEADLTKPIPAGGAIGNNGDLLPYSSRFSGNLSLQQDFPLGHDVTGFAGAALTYMGKRLGNFQTAGIDRQIFPAYAKMDLRTGVRYQSWLVNLYVNNIADRRGSLGGGVDGYPTNAIIYIQPRTAGISVARKF